MLGLKVRVGYLVYGLLYSISAPRSVLLLLVDLGDAGGALALDALLHECLVVGGMVGLQPVPPRRLLALGPVRLGFVFLGKGWADATPRAHAATRIIEVSPSWSLVHRLVYGYLGSRTPVANVAN